MNKRILTAVAIAGIAALTLTGCVDNSSGSGTADTAAAVSVDKAAAALVPADIAKTGILAIGVDATYPPNEYKDDAGNPIGWDIELADAVAAKLGLKTEYTVSSFANIIPSVDGGKLNMGVSSFTDNAERQQTVDFVDYYQAGILWASAAGKTVDPENACGLKVAVQATTYQDTDEVPAKSAACVDAGKAPITIVPFDTQDAATAAVTLGQVDAMSADSPVTSAAIAASKGKLQAAGSSFEVAPYGYVIAKGSKLVQAIQAALQSLIDDGTYAKILDKAGVASGAITKATINAGS
jgi:polar amino acid transport system substrate-binding protein